MQVPKLIPRTANHARVEPIGENSWRLSCPGGKAGQYRLAQLDDYHPLRRAALPWKPPCTLTLEARASANILLGTWGFGFWNDPFGMNLGYGGARLMPALPDAAWFFFASEPNYLSFRDDRPAVGALAAVFKSPGVPLWLLSPGLVAAPLLLFRGFSRVARRLAAALVKEESGLVEQDLTDWHTFELDWREGDVRFFVDGDQVKQTQLSPRAPLGLVVWLDNQYAAWTPDGRLKHGTLETDPRWIEIRNLTIT